MKKTLLFLVALLSMTTVSLAQVDFTCTAGANYGMKEGIDKMFDDNINTKFCGNTGDGTYALVAASEPVYVWGYELTTANDNERYGRLVTRWTLCGTNDESVANDPNAEGWVTLSGFGANKFVQQKNFNTQRFFCDKASVGTAYKYFKVVLNEGGFIQLSKFTFCYERQPIVTYNWHSSSNENSKKAVDWLLGQKWEGSNLAGNWVVIETADGEPHSVKSYSFSTNDDGSWTDRAPKTWKIEGSNDNASWITIHEVTEGNPIQNENYKTFDFIPTDNESAFRYLKLTLNSMKSTGWTQIGEFHVVGYHYTAENCPGHEIVAAVTVEPTCMEDGYDKGTCWKCGKSVVQPIIARGYHTYDDGLCTLCQAPQEDYMTAVDGYYQPTTARQFTWLAAMIQNGHSANIKLIQDVDLTGFSGFGNGDNVVPFKDEFDGQGHWLKNLRIDVQVKNAGLFGMTEGANIHDLGLDNAYVKTAWNYANAGGVVGNAKNTTINRVAVTGGSYVEGYDHVGAIAGNIGGSSVISNCMSDITVLSGAYQAGGLVGTSSGLILENCLFTGEVRNNNYNASGLIALIDSEKAPTVIRNNISAASQIWVGRSDGVFPIINTGGRKATYVNNRVAASTLFAMSHWDDDNKGEESSTRNYTNANDNNGLTTADADMKVKSFYTETMGWDMENDWTFAATGRYPVLAWMAKQQVSVSETGYATMVAEADVAIPEGVLAFAAKKNDETGRYTLIPVETAIPAGSAVIIKAAAGTYTFPYDGGSAEQITDNDLVAAMNDVNTDGTQYVLANGEQGIGFYKATGTIAAGKGYLVSANAAVKAFLLGEDSATGISAVQTDAEGAIYNVAGQRIQKMQKGINITGGKKVLK